MLLVPAWVVLEARPAVENQSLLPIIVSPQLRICQDCVRILDLLELVRFAFEVDSAMVLVRVIFQCEFLVTLADLRNGCGGLDF